MNARLPKVTPAGEETLAPVCALFRQHLREKGLKFTPERARVLDAVLKQSGLFEADALLGELAALGYQASRATVYRTLLHLVESGIIKQVTLDNSRSYYEVVSGRQWRDYLVCRSTGRVVEFSSPELQALCEKLCQQHGFEPVAHQLMIVGISPEGMAAAAAPEKKSPLDS